MYDTLIASAAACLTVRDVRLRLGRQVFGPFNFSIAPGERVAILGPSGAGKSSLLKALCKEQHLSAGSILFQQRALSNWCLRDLSRQRAVLPQSHEVAFGLPVDLVIGLGRVSRTYDPEAQKMVRLAAELACAAHLLDRRFDSLSGGEKARVQLARVFAQLWDCEQGLLLVDEPLAALDPGLQFQLMDAIESFADVRGHAVLAVLHDINHALLYFDRLLLLKGGRLVGDLATTDDAVCPQLEALYEVQLSPSVSVNGETLLVPVRSRSRPRVQECA